MAVEIEDNTYQVETEINSALALTLRLALEDVHRRSNPRTPLKDNGLRTSVLKTVVNSPMLQRGIIEWRVPYAAAQEQGGRRDPRTGKYVVFTNYTTPGTGKEFAERSVRETMKNFGEIAKQAGLI